MNKLAFAISHSGATFVIIVMIMVILVIVVLLISMRKSKKKENNIEIEQPVTKQYSKQQSKKKTTYTQPVQRPQQPENVSVHAVLIEKSDERKKTVTVDGATTISGESYEVTFNLRDGGRKHFEVSRKVFRDIPLGERGMLVFNRDGFIKFKTQNGVIED